MDLGGYKCKAETFENIELSLMFSDQNKVRTDNNLGKKIAHSRSHMEAVAEQGHWCLSLCSRDSVVCLCHNWDETLNSLACCFSNWVTSLLRGGFALRDGGANVNSFNNEH